MLRENGSNETLPRSARGLSLLLAACAIVATTTACGGGVPSVELPAKWIGMATNRSSSVEFRPDGTGTFEEFPLWNGGSCDSSEVVPYSGEFHWRPVDGYFIVDSPNSPIIFRADTELMGSQNWEELVVSLCGEETPGKMHISYLKEFF